MQVQSEPVFGVHLHGITGQVVPEALVDHESQAIQVGFVVRSSRIHECPRRAWIDSLVVTAADVTTCPRRPQRFSATPEHRHANSFQKNDLRSLWRLGTTLG